MIYNLESSCRVAVGWLGLLGWSQLKVELMKSEIIKKMFSSPESKPDFVVGQTVRVISRIDVNMPSSLSYWLDTKCKVLRVIPRGFGNREWCYELLHPNGKICEFKLEELDLRYRRRKAA